MDDLQNELDSVKEEWHREGCTCPKMDNDDIGQHYYFTVGCPLHLPKAPSNVLPK